jgi:hypothetical protein
MQDAFSISLCGYLLHLYIGTLGYCVYILWHILQFGGIHIRNTKAITVTLVPKAIVDVLKSSSRDEIDQPSTIMRCVDDEFNNDRGKRWQR